MQFKVEFPLGDEIKDEEARRAAYRMLFDDPDGRLVLRDICVNLCKLGGNISATSDDYIRENIGRQRVAHDILAILNERENK